MARSKLSDEAIATLEKRIGHAFASRDRLKRALTHSSATRNSGDYSHYERLEFLGDRVLGLCLAEMLYETFSNAREGELSVRLNTLVSGNTCAEIADEIGLHEYIVAGADVKQLRGKRMKSVRADVVESLIAAIYLDAGLAAAQDFVRSFWQNRLDGAEAANRDSKTALQEWAHSRSYETPRYEVIDQTGPDHDPVFTVTVHIEGVQGETGKGRSKRTAEQKAAEAVLLRENAWSLRDDGTIEDREMPV